MDTLGVPFVLGLMRRMSRRRPPASTDIEPEKCALFPFPNKAPPNKAYPKIVLFYIHVYVQVGYEEYYILILHTRGLGRFIMRVGKNGPL